jgi:hypothetical protein
MKLKSASIKSIALIFSTKEQPGIFSSIQDKALSQRDGEYPRFTAIAARRAWQYEISSESDAAM